MSERPWFFELPELDGSPSLELAPDFRVPELELSSEPAFESGLELFLAALAPPPPPRLVLPPPVMTSSSVLVSSVVSSVVLSPPSSSTGGPSPSASPSSSDPLPNGSGITGGASGSSSPGGASSAKATAGTYIKPMVIAESNARVDVSSFFIVFGFIFISIIELYQKTGVFARG